MRVALLVMKERRAILDELYNAVQRNFDQCDIYKLTNREQENIGQYLTKINHKNYERIVIVSRLKKLEKQISVLVYVQGLIFIEYDVCQNYMCESKYYGKYSNFYKKLPFSRVIASGYVVTKKLQDEGIDAEYVSKGYDETVLCNKLSERDIDLAFLGSQNGSAYQGRKNMLSEIALLTDILVTRTASGEEYSKMLNRIKIFLSADIGMGEYMIKNFEAMACGCVLFAQSQGAEEDNAIGFVSGENVIFYTTAIDAANKIESLKNNSSEMKRIAQNGQILAESRFNMQVIGGNMAAVIKKPMTHFAPKGILLRLWVRLKYGFKIS